jgi:hypothetical protein
MAALTVHHRPGAPCDFCLFVTYVLASATEVPGHPDPARVHLAMAALTWALGRLVEASGGDLAPVLELLRDALNAAGATVEFTDYREPRANRLQ